MAADQPITPFELLHALTIKGMAGPGPLAASLGRQAGELTAALAELDAAGLARRLPDRDLWRVTPEGQARHALLLDEEPPGLEPGYQRFLPLNGRLKDLCTRWQLRDGSPNDHSDAGYDRSLITELEALDAGARAVVAELAAARARFGRYGPRLTGALARVRDGDRRAFTGVQQDSYHDIWMELHRDLLVSLRVSAREVRR
jgi:DNA-binding MarR family transcriptional regulator